MARHRKKANSSDRSFVYWVPTRYASTHGASLLKLRKVTVVKETAKRIVLDPGIDYGTHFSKDNIKLKFSPEEALTLAKNTIAGTIASLEEKLKKAKEFQEALSKKTVDDFERVPTKAERE